MELGRMADKSAFKSAYEPIISRVIAPMKHIISNRKTLSDITVLSRLGYLENGVYHMQYGEKPILCRQGFEESCGKLFSQTLKTQSEMECKVYVNEKIHKDFLGQALMISSDSKYKIFNFRDKTVLSVMPKEEKNMLIDNIGHFQGCQAMLPVEASDDGIVQEIIDFIPEKKWNPRIRHEVFIRMIEEEIKFSSIQKIDSYAASDMLLNRIKETGLTGFITLAEDINARISMEDKMPCIWIHGDMHFGNILLTDDKIYFIDYEDVRIDCFFFDILNCIYVESAIRNNNQLLDLFLGKEDSMVKKFEDLFSGVGMKFYSDKVKEYYYFFLLCRILFDIGKASKMKRRVKKYHHFLQERYGRVLRYVEEF